jgi:hypothetical protein
MFEVGELVVIDHGENNFDVGVIEEHLDDTEEYVILWLEEGLSSIEPETMLKRYNV